MAQRLIDAERLKRHYSWWGAENASEVLKEFKHTFDIIVELQPTVLEKEDRLTGEEFLERLKEIDKETDGSVEEFHVRADEYMCSVLEKLGYAAGVSYFRKHPKWYS